MKLYGGLRTLTAAVFCYAISIGSASADESNPGTTPLIMVDDVPITAIHLALFAAQTGRSPQDPDAQLRVLNELVNNVMIANSPQGKALAQDEEIAAAIDVARTRLIAQAFIRDELDKLKIEDDELRARFEATHGDGAGKEFKARHILMDDRDKAVAAIERLDKGEDFAKLASELSIGPSKKDGGDLGWFEKNQMVSEFSEATQQLADGAYSKTPVKTQFGWHVILREESRDLPKPAFEDVREELERELRQEHVARLVAGIRDKTKIEIQQDDDSP